MTHKPIICIALCFIFAFAKEAVGQTNSVSGASETKSFFWQDNLQCTPKKALEDLGKTTIWVQTESDKVELVEFDLTGISGRGLQSSVVLLAHVGYSRTMNYPCSRSENCSPRVVDTRRGQTLNFCHSGPYPRFSYENMALALLAGLRLAWQFAEQDRRLNEMPPLRLSIDPQVSVLYSGVEVESPSTTQLSWTPVKKQRHRFIELMLPKMKPSHRPKIWENLLIAAHEMGHHILDQVAPNLIEDHTYTCNAHDPQRKLRTDRANDALNEGFADLFAHLVSLHLQAQFLDTTFEAFDFKGHRLNRLVSSSIWQDGSPKIMSSEIFRYYFGERAESTTSSIDYSDAHMIGAIFAYGIFSILKVTHGEDPYVLLPILLDWLSEMQRNYDAHHRQCVMGKVAFFDSIGFFAKRRHSTLNDPAVDEKVREIIQTVFPFVQTNMLDHWIPPR